MRGVFDGFATIAAVIALGALLAQLKVVDLSAQALLSRLAFFVASPALMLITLSEADVSDVLSANLVASGAGVAAAAGIYAALAALVWHRRLGEATIGALAASYVNAGNLGIPVAAYVLGDAAYVAPTLLMQLLVVQPVALALLDVDARGRRSSLLELLARPFTNPLTVGSLLGLGLALTGWDLPRSVNAPIELVGNMAVPGMLLGYGIALRLGPGLMSGGAVSELAATSALKLVVQPLAAFLVARFLLGVEGHALLAVVVTSSLPTAQNIFVHANRYDRATVLARDTILITTAGSVPVILLVAALLG